MGRNENILPARSEVINPAACYVIMNEELALICPALSIFGCFAVPSLHLIKYFINSYRLILTIKQAILHTSSSVTSFLNYPLI